MRIDEEMTCVKVGGSKEAYLAAKPLFLTMGKNTVYCGGAGNGSVSYVITAPDMQYFQLILNFLCLVLRLPEFAAVYLKSYLFAM